MNDEAFREAVKGMSVTAEKLAVVGVLLGFHTDDSRETIVEKSRDVRRKLTAFDEMKARAERAEKALEFARSQCESAVAARLQAEKELTEARDYIDNLETGIARLRAAMGVQP